MTALSIDVQLTEEEARSFLRWAEFVDLNANHLTDRAMLAVAVEVRAALTAIEGDAR